MKVVFLFVFVFTCVPRLEAQLPFEFSRRIQNQENIVNRLAKEVADVFDRRESYLRRCQCSRHACSSDLTNFRCTTRLGNVEGRCGGECGGRKIYYSASEFRTPPDMDISQLSTRVKESICLYSNLEPSMKRLVSPKNPSWVYFGSADGVMRIFPSAPREGVVQNEDNRLGQCRIYDPRVRPWFIGASTRPKDIVFVIDRSGSMSERAETNSSETRWQVTSRAVATMLGSLASFDYVNVVAFDDVAVRLDMRSPLRQGTTENLDYLIDEVKSIGPRGNTNFDIGFREAFNILSHSCNEGTPSQSCSGCHKIILFLTDGFDTTGSTATGILSNIEGYQKNLERTTSRRATIFTFSIGSYSDDSIPRQIACASSGSWSYIGPHTDVLTTMNSYFHFLTSSSSRASPIWINPYEDDGGLGQITTVAKPVYSRGSNDMNGIFLGVVGLDVSLSSLLVSGVGYNDVLGAILERSRTCDLTPQTPCQLQVHRNEYANQAICADNISPTNWRTSTGQTPTGDDTCYQHSGKYYKLFSSQNYWGGADQRCQSDGGRLVVIESEEELAFVAGVSSPDGSWIGARRRAGSQNEFEWTNSRISNRLLKESSASWGVGEPNSNRGTEQCVHIDRRGANGNLNDEDCSTRLSFICEYTRRRHCNNVVQTPVRGYFEIPPLNVCIRQGQALDTAEASQAARELSSNDVMCPLGPPRNSFESICCDSCAISEEEEESDSSDDYTIYGLPGGGVLVITILIGLYCWWKRKKKKKVKNEVHVNVHQQQTIEIN